MLSPLRWLDIRSLLSPWPGYVRSSDNQIVPLRATRLQLKALKCVIRATNGQAREFQVEKLGAIVLCGGQSRRMGRPKAWLPFGPELMLQRIIRLVSEAAKSIVVVASPIQDLPPLPGGVRIVRDALEGRGPLQGLAAGLGALGDAVTYAYATSTDVPFLVPAWITRLADLIGDDDMVLPEAGGYFQPLASIYRPSTVLPAVHALLRAGRLRTADLREAVRTRVIRADDLQAVDPELLTLQNINTPEEYHAALRRAGYDDPHSG
jgi:molybdenum cofactor guanylyltransferase